MSVGSVKHVDEFHDEGAASDPMADDLRDQLTVSGALRLARMMPVLEASRPSFLAEIVSIVQTRGRRPSATVEDAADVIRRWDDANETTQDVKSPPYLQALAAGVGLAVAGIGGTADRGMKIEHSTANFWDVCDDVVHRVDGYRSPVFAGLKTTLRGVEDLWQQGEARAFASGVPLEEVFERQIAKVQSSYDRRREVALVIARCAGWDNQGPSD